MNHFIPAQAGAQIISLAIYIAIARWYVAPWLSQRERADALIPLLWVNVFRYVALQIFAAQREGFPISMGGAMEIVIGDVGGAIIAFTAVVLLRKRSFAGVVLSWLLVAETVTDTFLNIRGDGGASDGRSRRRRLDGFGLLRTGDPRQHRPAGLATGFAQP
jgi:hypothetical protein